MGEDQAIPALEEITPVAVALSSDPGVQQMPSVAVDPHNSRQIAVAFQDNSLLTTGYGGIRVAVSSDGGQSWADRTIELPEGCDDGAADAVAHFDDAGHLFVSFMAARFAGAKPPVLNPGNAVAATGGPSPRTLGFSSNNGIFVARSDDGGLSWQPAVAIVAHQFDGATSVPFEMFPDLAIDTTALLPSGEPNPNYGNLYVAWARYYPSGQFPREPTAKGGSDVLLSVSADGGNTWQMRTYPQLGVEVSALELWFGQNSGKDTPAGDGYLGWPHISLGPEGNVYVADWVGSLFFVNVSTDGGHTFFVPLPGMSPGVPFVVPSSVSQPGDGNRFRTLPARAIAADPTRPGTVYVAEAIPTFDALGKPLDSADIFFARSTDSGRTWQRTIVNDDNGGVSAADHTSDVTAGQYMVKLNVSPQGDIGLVWYDTRRDPNYHNLDVFGAISHDGGLTFAPNFRISDQSFDANQGKFTAADGTDAYSIGDALGLAITDDSALVAWTDTRAGNQDVYFRRLYLKALPSPPSDRFEPNDSARSATLTGKTIASHLPRLSLTPGDEDWFEVQSPTTGILDVEVTAAGGESLDVEIRDAASGQVLSRGAAPHDAGGQVVGWQATTPAITGHTYLVQVTSTAGVAQYTLDIHALTADLGTLAYQLVQGTLAAGDENDYLLAAAADGTIIASASSESKAPDPPLVEVLDPQTLQPLTAPNTNSSQRTVSVMEGQRLIVRLTSKAKTGGASDYTLAITNLDQFTAPAPSALRFPGGRGPSQEAVADFNRDGRLDVAITDTGANVVSVLLGNGDGTFAAPRQFGVGAFQLPNRIGIQSGIGAYARQVVTGDFNNDGLPDLLVANFDSADVSVLLGRGDGTFQPQRRFDAGAHPFALAIGDLDKDGNLDFLTVDPAWDDLAVALGHGDGSFSPPVLRRLPGYTYIPAIALTDFDRDGALDLLFAGWHDSGVGLLHGNNDGTFSAEASIAGTRQATQLAVADLNGDGLPDLAATSPAVSDGIRDSIWYWLADSQGSFGAPKTVFVGRGAIAITAVDFGRQLTFADRSTGMGPPDGFPDLVVTKTDPSEVVVLPALVDSRGQFSGFGTPLHLATSDQPIDVKAADLNGDGLADLAVVDHDGLLVVFNQPPQIVPNATRETARELGTVVHLVQQTLTIPPAHEDAWYRFEVAAEVVPGSGDEVLDLSSGFDHLVGNGLRMEIEDDHGRLLASGDRVRLVAPQGAALYVHVLGSRQTGTIAAAGAYTLTIDALPQVAEVEATSLLAAGSSVSGGPITSLVLVLQGDRLDEAAAETAGNYAVTWLGPDGVAGTADDVLFIPGDGLTVGRAVLYDPSSNIEVSSGRTNPTAVRQTVTLLFGFALPAGSYRIAVSPQVQAAPLNDGESNSLTDAARFTGHPIVFVEQGEIREGSLVNAMQLVLPGGKSAALAGFNGGTRYLAQFHDDLGALLDALRTAGGDDPSITDKLLEQVLAAVGPAFAIGEHSLNSLLVLLLDPLAISLVDDQGHAMSYDLHSGQVASNLPQTFVEVGGNIEVVAVANPASALRLDVADVPPLARGGWVYLGGLASDIRSITADLRAGERGFNIPLVAAATRQSAAPDREPGATNLLAVLNRDAASRADSGALGLTTLLVRTLATSGGTIFSSATRPPPWPGSPVRFSSCSCACENRCRRARQKLLTIRCVCWGPQLSNF